MRAYNSCVSNTQYVPASSRRTALASRPAERYSDTWCIRSTVDRRMRGNLFPVSSDYGGLDCRSRPPSAHNQQKPLARPLWPILPPLGSTSRNLRILVERRRDDRQPAHLTLSPAAQGAFSVRGVHRHPRVTESAPPSSPSPKIPKLAESAPESGCAGFHSPACEPARDRQASRASERASSLGFLLLAGRWTMMIPTPKAGGKSAALELNY